MRLFLAIQCFFKVLFNGPYAEQVRQLALPAPAATAEKKPTPAPAAPAQPKGRSDAISLLATLQREARFVDLVSESLSDYSDAQIGAAARDVLADCGKVVNRLFALKPVVESEEGSAVDVPSGYDTGRFHLTGNVSQQPPLSGELMHAGWEATKCEVPEWTGSTAATKVIAPAEVQVK